MGTITSTLRNLYYNIAAITRALSDINADFSSILARIARSPGLPIPNPTLSFWQTHPLHPSLTSIHSPTLPTSADIVIIGSGITAAAIAKTLLEECAAAGIKRRIVVLEARTLASGATGRNGGHIKCAPYEAYAVAVKDGLGAAAARKVTAFQMRHLDVLVGLCHGEGWDEAECRVVETVDAFFDEEVLERVKGMVEVFEREWREMKGFVKVWGKEEAVKKFGLSSNIFGALSYNAGALWPYRLVACCFASLLEKYPSSLTIETNTPVTAITTTSDSNSPFELTTLRGTITATHVIHATNGYASHLIPGLRSKLFPIRGHMSAQQPGRSLPVLDGSRSWSFINKQGYEYVTQRPGLPSADKIGAEVMTGGGLFQSAGRGLDQIGVSDDSGIEHMTASHLSGVLPMGFGAENWGEERAGRRVQSLWSGILGFTPDRMPLVGRLDASITERKMLRKEMVAHGEVEPAEWIAAGYNGEGMVHAWLCGVAVALQALGRENVMAEAALGRLPGRVADWLPEEYEASVERIRRLNIAQMSME